jgi:hypothetical protein
MPWHLTTPGRQQGMFCVQQWSRMTSAVDLDPFASNEECEDTNKVPNQKLIEALSMFLTMDLQQEFSL